MPKTTLTAKFIRIPVDGGRIRVAPAFDDFLESDKMVVLELGSRRRSAAARTPSFSSTRSKRRTRTS